MPQLQAMGAKQIIVFGSYVERGIGLRSDLDLLVIMPPTKSGRMWMKEIYDQLERQIACDILAFTEKELQQQLPISRFLRWVITSGVTVFPTNDPAQKEGSIK